MQKETNQSHKYGFQSEKGHEMNCFLLKKGQALKVSRADLCSNITSLERPPPHSW